MCLPAVSLEESLRWDFVAKTKKCRAGNRTAEKGWGSNSIKSQRDVIVREAR